MLEQFKGHWRLDRRVTDHLTGMRSAFAGQVVLVPDGKGLLYEERGRWRTGPLKGMAGERRYLWRAERGQIAQYFEDGRPFLAVAPDSPQAAHWCDPDDYRVQYGFDLPNRWVAVWNVSGPRKDYRMVSLCRRLQAHD